MPRPPQAPDDLAPSPAFFFDRFELRPDDRLLLRDGEPVALRARAFDVLTVLVERAGRLVTKAELLDKVWAGVVVEEGNIASQMAALRKAVGGELVATVPGSGYRFTAEVRRGVAGQAVASDAAASAAHASAAHAAATHAGAAHASAAPASAGLASAAATPAATATVAMPSSPAPAGPLLFGRDEDLRLVRAALASGGCVTLAGPGGVGKTVLAQAVLRQWSAGPAGWVDLAALDDGAQLPGALCRALGIATPSSPGELRTALTAALRGTGRLLVLDNAEHLVDAVAPLCAMLAEALPALAVLVTSQVPLRIAGERVHVLEPLGLPGEDPAGEPARESASVLMLESRIRAADARFALGSEALPLLRSLSARLDGLPLALEMAASMVPLLGLGGVLAALDERFAVLRRGRREAPARHKTLHAALAWSHGLLAPAQQAAFRRLGVFASSFSLDLAVAMTADPGADRWEAVDTFAELVDRSLVASSHTEPPRYRLLESVRSFALEALDAAPAGEGEATRRRAVLALTAAMAHAEGADAEIAAAELANVPEALRWARGHEAAAAIGLAIAAGKVATWTPWRGEAARWIDSCEPLLGDDVPRALQAEWWRELARFQTFVRGARAVEAARQAAAIERELGNAEGLFWSLVPLLRSRVLEPAEFDACRAEAEALLAQHPEWPARGRVVFAGSLALEHRRRGDFEAALAHQQAEAALARQAGLHQLARNAESNLAATLVGLGRHEAALALLDAVDAAAAGADDPVRAHEQVQRLNALIGLGRLDAAEALAPEALARCRRFDVLDIEQVLAMLQALRGRPAAAALAVGHYRQSLVRLGAEPPADSHAPWREALRRAEAALGAERARSLVERGATLERSEADAQLLDRSGPG